MPLDVHMLYKINVCIKSYVHCSSIGWCSSTVQCFYILLWREKVTVFSITFEFTFVASRKQTRLWALLNVRAIIWHWPAGLYWAKLSATLAKFTGEIQSWSNKEIYSLCHKLQHYGQITSILWQSKRKFSLTNLSLMNNSSREINGNQSEICQLIISAYCRQFDMIAIYL